ncbi:DUF4123 domain-containing protein [Acetobacter sp. DsW_063]|uniref:DUF4123 domain-containing protein n=1 Tax=Acetobacter sp. DsW_063 TaxID=1514894 RepID=UPI000A3BD63A|nr:DUF4123 domain-containing protein [Acetobacter sp. DsW_063]OUJ14922.1 hypothetical protein HK28_10875 [Acetobacter sp. DsW_063]
MVPEEFRKRLFDWPDAPVPVAFDGALFDDLPSLLKNAGFKPRSLFLEQTDREIQRTSPQYIMAPRDRLELLLSLPDITTGGVFWNAPGVEEMAFYRHLRSLTMVRLPVPEEEQKPGGPKTEMHVFRHFDPATVAITMPAMKASQRARLLGPAKSLLLDAPEGVFEAKCRDNWPSPTLGALCFTSDQLEGISNDLLDRSRKKIAEWLRLDQPLATESMTNMELINFVKQRELEARNLGASTEEGFGYYSKLWLISNGEITHQQETQKFLCGPYADARLRVLMNQDESLQGKPPRISANG